MRTNGIALFVLILSIGLAHTADDTPAVKLSESEQQMLKLLNESRAKEKLPPLRINQILMKVARAHAANMAKQKKMAHDLEDDSKKVKTPGQRVLQAGYDYKLVGENVAFSEGDKPGVIPVDAIQESWMKSEHHRENILKPGYEEVGFGIAFTADKDDMKQIYYCQVFGTHRRR
jgi:streptogrisin C